MGRNEVKKVSDKIEVANEQNADPITALEGFPWNLHAVIFHTGMRCFKNTHERAKNILNHKEFEDHVTLLTTTHACYGLLYTQTVAMDLLHNAHNYSSMTNSTQPCTQQRNIILL